MVEDLAVTEAFLYLDQREGEARSELLKSNSALLDFGLDVGDVVLFDPLLDFKLPLHLHMRFISIFQITLARFGIPVFMKQSASLE